jgi:hypothetical protein
VLPSGCSRRACHDWANKAEALASYANDFRFWQILLQKSKIERPEKISRKPMFMRPDSGILPARTLTGALCRGALRS